MFQYQKRNRHFIQFSIFFTLFIGFTVLLFASPLFNIMTPKEIDDFTTLNTKSNEKYVTLTIPTLCYSGYDYVKDGSIKGHYYYALEDNTCLFVLLEPHDQNPPEETISQASISCKLIKNKSLLSDLAASMSKQINWTSDGLLSITCPYIASSINYPIGIARFFVIFLCVQITVFFIRSLYHLYKLVKH